MKIRLPLVAVAIGLLGLWPVAWCLWPDEVFTAGVVGRDVSGIVHSAAQDRHPPLYYLWAAALRFLGNGDTAVRIPSGIAALAMVALLSYGASRRDARLGWLSLLFAGFAPVTVLFAHTARMYALLGFFGALLLAGTALLREGSRWGLLALGLGATGALYTHYASAGVVLAAYLAGLAVAWPRRDLLAGTVVVGAASLLCFAPWALGPFQEQLAQRSDPTPRNWAVLLYVFWGHTPRIQFWNWVLLGLQGLGVVGMWRRGERWHLIWVALMIAFPLAISNSEPAQNPRNYLGFFPFAVVLMAEGVIALTALHPRLLPILDYLPPVLLLWPLTDLLRQDTSPQDNGHGHDYRLEARVLDQIVPADATLKFEPSYVQNHYSRYAPALKQRNGSGGTWVARTSGGKKEGCTFSGAFRVSLSVPEEQCDAVRNAIAETARKEDYSPFWVEVGKQALDQRDFAAAAEAAKAALRHPQRHPSAWELLARAETGRGNTAAALEALDEALEVARGWEYNGRQIAALWDANAKLLRKMERTAEAETAEAAGQCARSRRPGWACGTWSWLTLSGAEGPIDSASGDNKAETPKAPKAGGSDRGDWKDVEVRGLPQRWEFDEPDLPPGWVRTGAAADEQGILVVGDSKGVVDVACTPLFAVSGPVTLQIRWQADILSLPPPTWAVIEARPSAADGRPLPNVETSRFFGTRQALPMTTDTTVWTPPEGTSIARICVKTGGAANGSSRVDWLEISPASL